MKARVKELCGAKPVPVHWTNVSLCQTRVKDVNPIAGRLQCRSVTATNSEKRQRSDTYSWSGRAIACWGARPCWRGGTRPSWARRAWRAPGARDRARRAWRGPAGRRARPRAAPSACARATPAAARGTTRTRSAATPSGGALSPAPLYRGYR